MENLITSMNWPKEILRVLLLSLFVLHCQPPEYPVPRLDSVTPTKGSPGTIVTITGSFFENVSSVSFGSQEVTGIHVDPAMNVIIATVPADAPAGPVKLKAAAGKDFSNEIPFEVTPTLPVIEKILPVVGKIGETVSILGHNFTVESRVQFGTIEASKIEYVNPNALAAQIPANALIGTNLITVTTPQGSSASPFSYDIASEAPGAPMIASVEPLEQYVGGVVQIKGSNFFINETTMTFLDKDLKKDKDFEVVSESQINFTIPPWGESGLLSINNSVATISFQMEVVASPEITKIIPASNGPGGPIIIYGNNLKTAKEIQVSNGKLLVNQFHVTEDNGLDVLYGLVPNAKAGKSTVKVINDRNVPSMGFDYVVTAAPVDLPLGFSNVVFPNLPSPPAAFGISNQWIFNGEDSRRTLSQASGEIGVGYLGIEDNFGNMIGYYKKDGTFISMNIDGVIHEGKLDEKYGGGKNPPYRIILTPVTAGQQRELIVPLGLDSLSPAKGSVGTTISIFGRYFGQDDFDPSDCGGSSIRFQDPNSSEYFDFFFQDYCNYEPSPVFTRISPLELRLTIPETLTPKVYDVTVLSSTAGQSSNSLRFKVVP